MMGRNSDEDCAVDPADGAKAESSTRDDFKSSDINTLRLACQALAHELHEAARMVTQDGPSMTVLFRDYKLEAWATRLEAL